MHILKSVKYWVYTFLDKLLYILVPEDRKIEKICAMDSESLRLLLPKSPVHMKDTHVLFNYGNQVVKMMIKSVKYKNNLSLKKKLALFLYEEIVDLSSEISLFEGSLPIVVPMPMSKNEKKDRGWNQCEELAKEIEKLGNVSVYYNILKKIRETKRQTTLSKEERIKNVRNSMKAEQSKREYFLKNKTVIVLDDVYTTLASFREAERALLEAGTKHVIGLFVAH